MTELAIILGAIAAAIAGLLGYGHHQRRAGRKDAEHKANADTLDRQRRGREAVRDGRASGRDPDDRLRDNDAHW